MKYRLCRIREALNLTGYGQTTFYTLIANGTLPPAVKITSRSSAWPEHELIAVNRARIAGKTDAEIRALVTGLVAARATGDSPSDVQLSQASA